MRNGRSVEGEYRVDGSVLDALGLDRQAALELKLKAGLHQRILQLVKRRVDRARELERVFVSRIQQPRVSELMRGKLSTLSVARLLLYADLLGAEAEVRRVLRSWCCSGVMNYCAACIMPPTFAQQTAQRWGTLFVLESAKINSDREIVHRRSLDGRPAGCSILSFYSFLRSYVNECNLGERAGYLTLTSPLTNL